MTAQPPFKGGRYPRRKIHGYSLLTTARARTEMESDSPIEEGRGSVSQGFVLRGEGVPPFLLPNPFQGEPERPGRQD